MNSEIAAAAVKFTPEMQAEYEAMQKRNRECNTVIQKKGAKLSKTTSQSSGMILEGIVIFTKDGMKNETDTTKMARPSKIRFEMLSLPESVSPKFGAIELDTEHEDEQLKNLPVVDANGNLFDMATQAKGVKVLKVKIRYKFDPKTMMDYSKDVYKKDRAIYRVMYVYPGDTIDGSNFNSEKPEVEVGDVCVVTGASCNAYLRKETQTVGTGWNISKATKRPCNLEDELTKKVLAPHLEVPRNSYLFQKIEEAPIDRSDGNYDQHLSPELQAFLDQRVLFTSWKTEIPEIDAIDDEDEKNKAKAIVATHFLKKYNIEWDVCNFSASPEDYVAKVTRDGRDEVYIGLKFRQNCTIKDKMGETTKVTVVLNEMDALQLQARELMGISSSETYSRLAPIHAPRLRFMVLARPSHKKTFESDMNLGVTRNEEDSKFDYKIVWTPTKTAFFHSNLKWYVTENGYPVTFDFVKELVGEKKASVKSPFSDTNFYNNVPGSKFFNLSEYTGDLNEFAEDYVFFVLDSRPVDEDRMERVSAIEDFDERAQKCSMSLLQKVSRNEDPVRLGNIAGFSPTVYALHKTLYEQIQAEPDKYNLSIVKDHIEKIQLETDPGEKITATKSELVKRKRESTQETYDSSKHFKPSSEDVQPTTGLAQIVADADQGTGEDAEESV